MLAYGSLCRGLLSGKMTIDSRFTGDDLRNNDPKFQAPRFAQYLAAVEALDRFAHDNYGKGVIHLAVRWVLDRGDANVALWGARRPDQLAAVREAMGWHIDSAAMTEIERILRDTIRNPVGPEFMAPPDRLCCLVGYSTDVRGNFHENLFDDLRGGLVVAVQPRIRPVRRSDDGYALRSAPPLRLDWAPMHPSARSEPRSAPPS